MSQRRVRFVPMFVAATWVSCAALVNAEPVQLIPPVLDHHDVSPPLRDIVGSKQGQPRRVHEHVEVPLQEFQGGPAFDPAVQAPTAPLVATTPGLNFPGLGLHFPNYETTSAPPDPNGAIGAFQFIQTVNVDFAVFSKATGALLHDPAPISSIWQGFGGACAGNSDTDPIVLYDKLANRWVMTREADSGSSHFECIAVSQTADALGTWNRYAWEIQVGVLNDYPKIAVWPNAYFATFNMFSGGTFLGPRVCAFDRAAMLVNATPAMPVCCALSNTYSYLLPSDLDGVTTPPAGAANYVMALGTNALLLWRFTPNFISPSCADFASPISITVAAFNQACGNGGPCVPQAGTNQTVASLGNRIMHRLAYRNMGAYEALVATHSIQPNSRIRWYEIRSPATTPVIFQQGTFAPADSNYRWNQSIAMDRLGNIAVGYNVSSASMNPAIRYTGRAVTDPLGTLQSENTVINGTGSQVGGDHWGDYSSMSVDPIFDCTFWQVNEYYQNTTPPLNIFDWDTRIASFRFPQCTQCVGDCDRNYTVNVNEIVTMVNITMGNQPLSNCYRGDGDGSGEITVGELNQAINDALAGCPTGGSGAMAGNPAAATSSIIQQIGSASGARGSTVTIPVTLTGGGGTIAGTQLDVLYSATAFNAPTCVKASRLTNHSLSTSFPAVPAPPPGQIRLRTLIVDTNQARTFTDGQLFSCSFPIKTTAPTGTYPITGERQHVSDHPGNEPSSGVGNGTITVF